ncbi:RHS repeat-associated core domain-containing protein [Roseateles koreensis]|uniref:Teneurin-like YD-shell domain-containing protein n=1 Tax=Roseateles koreensis TaxID=2987526 RepID=A0ABT5KSI0_9BURK|nr:RHS repeat-associated core domain-containing protein [Roseateles koreensis]MDC8785897.1 hypothetical protein [Roseateles koreensis]
MSTPPRQRRQFMRLLLLLLCTAWTGLTARAQGLPPLPVSPTPIVQYEYDAEGHPTRIIVAPTALNLNLSTQHTYDPLGRRISSADALSGLTQLGYNGQDRLTQVSDPRRLNTQYQRDGLGQTQALRSPDTGATQLSYDAAGHLKTRQDARGALSTYSYDALGRPLLQTITQAGNSPRQFTWTYDQTGANYGYGIGRLTTATTPEVSSSWSYDAWGRVRQETATFTSPARTQTVGYTYDAAGHVTRLSYPSGLLIDFEYNNGQPVSIQMRAPGSNTTTPLLSQITLQPFGPAKSWQWQMSTGPQLHERFFDDSGRMIRHPLGPLVRDLRYDEADRISSFLHYDTSTGAPTPAFDQRFSYDALGRLTDTQLSNTRWSFAYDANGNRSAASVGINARAYSVASDSNRLNSINNPSRALSYDATGNRVSDIATGLGSASSTASYNQEGRLARMNLPGIQLDMAYDAQGRRVRRGMADVLSSTGSFSASSATPSSLASTATATTTATATATATATTTSTQAVGGANRRFTYYAYDPQGHLLGEYAGNGTALSEYVWLGDIPVAVIQPNTANASNPPNIYFVHTDHLDTPRVLMDRQNQLRWRWMAEPFGITPAENSPSGLPSVDISLRLPGQQFDPDTGLHYNMARDYDPTVGGYVQSDPIGLQGGINTYAYVGGNPVSRMDPSGLLDRLVFDGKYLTGFEDMGVEFRVPAVSGPWDLGRLPEGVYNGSNLRQRNEKGNKAMQCEGKGWSLDLDPAFKTTRDLLRIHPDGNVPGTQGCIGPSCGAAQQTVHDALRSYFNDGYGSIPVIVRYPR